MLKISEMVVPALNAGWAFIHTWVVTPKAPPPKIALMMENCLKARNAYLREEPRKGHYSGRH
jgi:hypothetical protein